MLQVLETTDEEKAKMYNKLPKSRLIEMLIQANKIIDGMEPKYEVSNAFENNTLYLQNTHYCTCHSSQVSIINGKWICAVCNKEMLVSH